MKVVQLTPWYSPYTGGVELHVKSISEGLRRLGCDVKIFTFTKSEERDTKSFRFMRVPSVHECYSIIPSPSLLAELLRSGANVVHAHSYGYPMAWAATFIKKALGIPFVYTLHSDPYSRVYPFNDGGRLLPAKVCDIIIATTKFEENHLNQMGISSAKIRTIPQGLDVKNAGPRPMPEPYILCLGRVVFHHKGQDMLLQAYETGKFRHKLVFAGDGADLLKLKRMAAGNPNVLILGTIGDAEKWALLGNADLVVMPSRLEPYGHVAMEALALGRRLVATRVGGLQHIAAPYAVIADPNSDSLSEAMHTALQEDPHGKQLSFSVPSWEAVAQQIFEVYNEVISQRL